MKIWIDARKISFHTNVWKFIYHLVNAVCEYDKKNEYTIFLNKKKSHLINNPWENISIIHSEIIPWSFLDHTQFGLTLTRAWCDLFLFPDVIRPVSFFWKSFVFSFEIEKYFYSLEKMVSSVYKHVFNFFVKNTLNKATLIINFSNDTQQSINERLDISEDNMTIIAPWFFENDALKKDIEVDIKIKYNIYRDFIIYSWGAWTWKNATKMIEAFSNCIKWWLDVDMVFLWSEVYHFGELREAIGRNSIWDHIHFIDENDKEYFHVFYDSALWCIYPALHDTFMFNLGDAINYKLPILASNISVVNEVFGKSVEYFNPKSVTEMSEAIMKFAKKKKKSVDYSKIQKKYNLKSMANKLTELYSLDDIKKF